MFRAKQTSVGQEAWVDALKMSYNWKFHKFNQVDPMGIKASRKDAFLESHARMLKKLFDLSLVANKSFLKEVLLAFNEETEGAFSKVHKEDQLWWDGQAYGLKQLFMDVRQRATRVMKGTRQPQWLMDLLSSYRDCAAAAKADEVAVIKEEEEEEEGFQTPKKKKKRALLIMCELGSPSMSSPGTTPMRLASTKSPMKKNLASSVLQSPMKKKASSVKQSPLKKKPASSVKQSPMKKKTSSVKSPMKKKTKSEEKQGLSPGQKKGSQPAAAPTKKNGMAPFKKNAFIFLAHICNDSKFLLQQGLSPGQKKGIPTSSSTNKKMAWSFKKKTFISWLTSAMIPNYCCSRA